MLARVTPAATLSEALLRPPVEAGGTALLGADGAALSFDALGRRVDDRRRELELPPRSVVALDGPNSVEWVVTYLALLADGHVPLLAGSDASSVADAWRAQAIASAGHDGLVLDRTGAGVVDLHPDLALLVSTSGSTGSPKLVRLSQRNLVANAVSIARFQRLTAVDRGITSLPLHYCFGLSILHSHLLVGAGVVVTDGSVVDPCFRTALSEHRVTNLAGVPHTYDMIERVGAEEFAVPSLRLLTQAGGKLAAERVMAWTERADRWGAEFMVMYGQTEATARIAYLPPRIARRRPGAIGVPIPGGRLSLEPVEGAGAGVGELVYEGDNVMMGYAVTHHDLTEGAVVDRLRTGDLARFHADDGVYEIVGRRARFVKPFGVRIDLDALERRLGIDGAAVAGDDERLVVFVGPTHAPTEHVRARVAELTGLPIGRVTVRAEAPPRTPSGKVDAATMMALTAPTAPTAAASGVPAVPSGEVSVASVFQDVLGARDVADDDTFVSLGGDSLSYVESSIRLERALGDLPSDWHLMTVAELQRAGRPRRRLARLDTTVLLRAVAICMVVATHMRVWHVPGGAHTLLAVAGYNLARFLTPIESPVDRLRAGLRTAGRIGVPTIAWVGTGMLLFGSYGVGTLLLVNNYVGPASHDGDHWHFWFIEVFVHLVVLATLLLAIPAVGRLDRRHRFVVPAALLAVALLLRTADLGDWYNLRFRTHGVAWFFLLGWLIQRSTTWWHRAATTVVCLAVIPGFFRIAEREWRIAALLLLLLWFRRVPVPERLVAPVGVLAAASMWIYISHFTFWPLYREVFVREAAYVCTIATGVAVWAVAERTLAAVDTWRRDTWRRSRAAHRPPTTTPHLRGTT